MTRKLNLLLLLAAVFGGLPFGWFMLDTSTSGQDIKPVTLAQLRALAASMPGPAPSEARYEIIARRRAVGDLLAAGSGLRPVSLAVRAYELVSSDGRTVTIDRGMSRKLAESQRVSDFDPVAQAVVDQSVARASVRLLLSLKPQHSGTFAIPEGYEAHSASQGTTHANAPFAAAPGVVVIPADGIRLGERMVYARLSDGAEILFAGDVASVNVSWSEQRPPARLITMFLAPGDREQIAAWLRTIQALKAAAPKLQVVAGHDTALPRIVRHGFVKHDAVAQPGKSSKARSHKRLARRPSMR